MPAPIKIKIPSLEKRITGLTSGTSNPSGTNVFNNNTHQNIHKKLQSGLSSFQVGYDFVVGTGEIHNQIKHLFDEDTTTSINIKHENKINWIVFDLGKNREINRLKIRPSGVNPGGSTPSSQNLSLQWFFWTKDQTLKQTKQLSNLISVHQQ